MPIVHPWSIIALSTQPPFVVSAAKVRSPPFGAIECSAAKVLDGLRAELRCNAVWIMGADGMLYELAYELELARPWKDQWAPYSVKFIPV